MNFSYKDFSASKIKYPRYFHTLWSVDKSKLLSMEKEANEKGKSESAALSAIANRTSKSYFKKLNMAQIESIIYSESVFPTYKFILPDAIYDDWLSTLDPHKEHCRDHTLHQPLTAYVVAKLLGYGNPKDAFNLGPEKGDLFTWCGNTLLNSPKTEYLRQYFYSLYPKYKILPKGIMQKLACDVFYETAVVSALFHDIGYPWQYISRLNKSILAADFRKLQDIHNVGESIRDTIRGRLLEYPFYGYSHVSKSRPVIHWDTVLDKVLYKSSRETHGFPGALAFTVLQDSIRQFPGDFNFNDAVFRFIYDWAAVGIMMHDMLKVYRGNGNVPESPFLRLSFESDPLSSIISLADVIEEFERPCSHFPPQPSGEVKLIYDYPCISTELILIGDVLDFTYLYKTPKDVALNIEGRKKEIDNYFNTNSSFVDLTPLGISRTECNCRN